MKRYAEDGCRLTDCCGCYSTYMDCGGVNCRLCCKQCYNEVEHGQGDGSEYKENSLVGLAGRLIDSKGKDHDARDELKATIQAIVKSQDFKFSDLRRGN